MDTIFPGLMAILPTLPLFIIVLIAVGYAGAKRSEIGRPAQLVLAGGSLTLVSLLISMVMNASLMFLVPAYDAQTIGMIFGISGFVTMILSTIGWGMILYAVFVDRKISSKLDF